MNVEIKELLEKYEKAIELGVVNKNDLISCSEEEKSIYKNIDIETLLYILSCDHSLEDSLRKHLSLRKIREISSSRVNGKETYLKDLCLITELSSLGICAEYPLLIADLFAVSGSVESLSSPFHDVHMQSLATNILSDDDGSLKEAKSYAVKKAVLNGKVDKLDDNPTKMVYPETHLQDILTILSAECEEACFSLGRIVMTRTPGKWDIRNRYMSEVAQSLDLDRIDILTDVAVDGNSKHSDYYGLNIEILSSMEELSELDKLVATNPTSLDSAHHAYNMQILSKLHGCDVREALAVLTSIESLDSGSHMSNIEEYLESKFETETLDKPYMLIKANN